MHTHYNSILGSHDMLSDRTRLFSRLPIEGKVMLYSKSTPKIFSVFDISKLQKLQVNFKLVTNCIDFMQTRRFEIFNL